MSGYTFPTQWEKIVSNDEEDSESNDGEDSGSNDGTLVFGDDTDNRNNNPTNDNDSNAESTEVNYIESINLERPPTLVISAVDFEKLYESASKVLSKEEIEISRPECQFHTFRYPPEKENDVRIIICTSKYANMLQMVKTPRRLERFYYLYIGGEQPTTKVSLLSRRDLYLLEENFELSEDIKTLCRHISETYFD